MDNKHLTSTEDGEQLRTYAQSNTGEDGQDGQVWQEESRKLQADLLAVLERVATEEDLDAITGP